MGIRDGSSRAVSTLLWLGPVAVAWAALIACARAAEPWATPWLPAALGGMLLFTYLASCGLAIRLSRNRRLARVRAAVLTMSLAGIVVCFEVAAALHIVHWRFVWERLAGDEEMYRQSFRGDAELAFRRVPNAHWSARPASDIEHKWNARASLPEPIVFTFDRWGYRNVTDLERADVALIGDSYVEGWYVSDDETAAHQLAARLGRPVVNLGVAGYGTLQELVVLERDAMRFEPGVVVWFFFEGNDFYDDQSFEYFQMAEPANPEVEQKGPEWRARLRSWLDRSFTRAAMHRLRRASARLLPDPIPYSGRLSVPGRPGQRVHFADYATVGWDEWAAERWDKARAALETAADFSRARDLDLLFVFVPIKFRVYRPFVEFAPDSPCATWEVWPLDERFAEFCRDAAVPCLDLTDLFRDAVRGGGMPYAAADSHWGPEGHALVAERLSAELVQRGWLSGARP